MFRRSQLAWMSNDLQRTGRSGPALALCGLVLLAQCVGCGKSSSTDVGAMPTGSTTSELSPQPLSKSMRFAIPNVESKAEMADASELRADGQGPGMGGDKFSHIIENSFVSVSDQPLSTFSVDVDTASYAKTRMFLMQRGSLPPADAVRIEEFVNYFDYQYSPPSGEHPFAIHLETAAAPWNPQHRLLRVGLKGQEIQQERPNTNLVFLLDVSGSMNRPNKLPLLKQALRMLVAQMESNDRVAIVVYAGAAGLVLPSTPGDRFNTIMESLDNLRAGGSTNGGQGIQLAYRVAKENFIPGGVNRVLLCTDGDFNVGTTSTGDLVRLAEEEARSGVFVSVLAFGMGNHNDAMLEELSNKADGNYSFIDSAQEARKVLQEQMQSTLVTIAKDVKIQVEFNPTKVAAYRLIGYENRRLAAEDFNDDTKDAGEVGAGHTVTALYELAMVGSDAATAQVDPLKYQTERTPSEDAASDELLNLKLRYKRPEEDTSNLLVQTLKDDTQPFARATPDFQFAAAVAAFGMLLRQSEHSGDASYDGVLEIAGAALGGDRHGYRSEFLQMVTTARRLAGTTTGQIQNPVPRIQYAQQAPHNPNLPPASYPVRRSRGLVSWRSVGVAGLLLFVLWLLAIAIAIFTVKVVLAKPAAVSGKPVV